MKFLFLLVIILWACNNSKVEIASANVNDFNAEVEKAAIMQTIENETNSFYKRDYKDWKESFIHAGYVFQAWNNEDGTFASSVGWEAIDKRISDHIKNNPVKEGESLYPRVERKNMVVKFFSDSLAYLVWDQYNGDKDNRFFFHSKDERIMQKQNGQWKIANVSSYWDYKNKIPVDSLK